MLCGGIERTRICNNRPNYHSLPVDVAIAIYLARTNEFAMFRRVTYSKTHLGATCTKQRACAHLLSVLSGPLRGHNGAMCETAARLRPDIEALTARNAWGADGPIPEITVVRVAFVVHSPCRRCRIVSSRSCSACGGEGGTTLLLLLLMLFPPIQPRPVPMAALKKMAGQILRGKTWLPGQPWTIFSGFWPPGTSRNFRGEFGRPGALRAVFGNFWPPGGSGSTLGRFL